MQRRHLVLAVASMPLAIPAAHAHHGWSSFDQDRPIYLEGKVASVRWQNPHAELVIDLSPSLKLPPDLAQRALPAQSAPTDGPGLLAKATLPTRKDHRWELELAPLTRMNAWKIDEIRAGATVAALGFTFKDEKGEAVMRVEYLFADGKTYGLRSSPV